MGEQREEFRRFECGAFDSCLIEQIGWVEQAAEVEGCADRDKPAHLGGALLLLADPFRVGAGFECQHPVPAELGACAGGQALAQAFPLKRSTSALG